MRAVLSPLALASPLAVYPVDPASGLPCGFDLHGGAPDPGRQTAEAELCAGILQVLGVDTAAAGLPDVPAMRPG